MTPYCLGVIVKQTSYEGVKNWRNNTKIRLFQAFGGKCGCCGLVDEMVCYDFHHLGEDVKEFQLSQKIKSWKAITLEAQKCCMLCALCHRKFHAGFIDLPATIQKFDEDLINRKITHDQCPVCDELKPLSQKTCSSSCAAKTKTSRIWDNVDLAELLDQFKNAYAISRHLNVSDTAVRKRLRKIGLIP